MLFKTVSTKKPKVNKPYSKKKKKEIDSSTKNYHPSSYWDHMYTSFYEVSVSQNHKEAIQEWQLVDYKHVPKNIKDNTLR